MKKFSRVDFLDKKKVLDFLDKKGFYLILLLCVGIITLTAYTVTKRNLSSYMESVQLEQLTPPVTNIDERLNLSAIKEIQKPVEKKTIEPKSTTAKANITQTKPVVNPIIKKVESVHINMGKPVLGDVSLDYAKTRLVYSKTLDEWTTHNGLDFMAARGTPVKAVLDGTVSEVFQDTMYGITIILDHGNDIKTKYSNLSIDNMVKTGDSVKKGTVISGVGNTAILESSEPSHLHFEVLQNGQSVNPRNFIK